MTTEVPAPVARVAVDMSLPHLDRLFDYQVPSSMAEAAVVGARVRVRFAGQLRDGFIVELDPSSDHEGKLSPLHAVLSAEPVLAPQIATLIRRVADHYAGTFADVMRLAVPPRHAATEKATPRLSTPQPPDTAPGPLDRYPTGTGLLGALGSGGTPRAYWQVCPGAGELSDWAQGLAQAAAATVAGGRGALLIVPDQRDLDRLARACTQRFGADGFARLSAELGPSVRYRQFLRISRGQVKVVIGTRAAAYAPVHELGLVALWDDGDDVLSEPRAPYPHTREVLILRSTLEHTGALLAGYARTSEVQQLVESSWLTPVELSQAEVRRNAPVVRVASDTDEAMARDPAARAARLPHDTFTVARAALPQGPVLVQIPRAGYRLALACEQCRTPIRCPHCSGPAREQPGGGMDCAWCGRLFSGWRCPVCGSDRHRAPVVGATRLAEELGRAFPGTKVVRSAGNHILAEVDPRPALVVVTPGAEPVVAGGYAAALLVDADALLARADLRAGEEALRRWLNATALVRPAADGGTVMLVGSPTARAVQALVRTDPAGFARRELTDRAEAHFPPAAVVATIEGALASIEQLMQPIADELPAAAEILGPVPIETGTFASHASRPREARRTDEMVVGEDLHRLTIRVPRPERARLTRLLQQAQGVRSARKDRGGLRVRIDPIVMD